MISDLVIKFDDFVLSDFFGLLSEPEMSLFAPINNELVQTDDGQRLVDSHRDKNTIRLSLYSTHGHWRVMKDELAIVAADGKTHKLWFSHEPDRYYLAKLDGESRLSRTIDQSNESEGELIFIVPDGLAHAITESNHTWDDIDAEPVVMESDFAGKIAGSEVECPHELKYGPTNATSLLTPEDIRWGRGEQVHYDSVMYLDNTLTSANRNADGLVAQWLISYNILETVKRAYPGLFEGLGESERVEKLKKMIITVVVTMFGKGSSPSSKYVTYSNWNVIAKAWFRWGGNNGDAILEKKYTWENVDTLISTEGLVNILAYADPSDGTTPSSVSLDYTDIEITIKLPDGNLVTITNEGTYKTPVDIHATFLTDADTIGFVSKSNVVQLGTQTESETTTLPAKEIIFNNPLNPGSAKDWQINAGRIRWRENDENNKSKRQGTFTWQTESVTVNSYGPDVPAGENGYWHGPTLTHYFGQYVDDFDSMNRFSFKPTGKTGNRKGNQGIFEINMVDADNNFVMGFEMKDNVDYQDRVTYSFFIGDVRLIEGNLPRSVVEYAGGFFGSIQMRKTGNKFFFRLARQEMYKGKFRETWSTQQSYNNETVAMLSVARIDTWFSKWRNKSPMIIQFSDSKFWKLNTTDLTLVPLHFYEGDELFVEGDTNRVYLNGQRADDYRIVGSDQIFWSEPGETEIVVLTDGEVEVELTTRGRFL